MLKAFDCYFDKHSPLRVFAEDGEAAKAEYVRLYALAPVAEYQFHFAEVDPRLPPPVEIPGWRLRRELSGTVGTERKLTDEPHVVEPSASAPQAPVSEPDAPPTETPTPEQPAPPATEPAKPEQPPPKSPKTSVPPPPK